MLEDVRVSSNQTRVGVVVNLGAHFIIFKDGSGAHPSGFNHGYFTSTFILFLLLTCKRRIISVAHFFLWTGFLTGLLLQFCLKRSNLSSHVF
jgi:hypothetical protein